MGSTPGAQPSIKLMVKIKAKREANKLVGRCLLWTNVPFSIAKNNLFYQSMFEVVVIVGPGYQAPTYEELRGPILENAKVDCNLWRVAGVPGIMGVYRMHHHVRRLDGWEGQDPSQLLAPLSQVYETSGCNHISGMQHYYASCWMGSSMRLGHITLSKSITLLIMWLQATFFWTPCATHCIDLILEDMGKLDFIKETTDSAQSITKYIYNHASMLPWWDSLQATRNWCGQPSHALPLASFLFNPPWLLGGRWRECFFQMSGMLCHIALDHKGMP